MEITDALLRDDVRTRLKITVAALLALWIGIRYYRVVKAEEDSELETLKSQADAHARLLRIVTERRFDDAAETMPEDERLAVQRRAEALNWLDEGYTADEETRKTA